MAELDAGKRSRLPDSAFAYVDSKGRRRLPIQDAAHVRNALARFNQVAFEDEAARERARQRLLRAARKHGIVPTGFIDGQLRSGRRQVDAGRLVVDLGSTRDPEVFEERLRRALHDPTVSVLHWSESAEGYLDRTGRPIDLPGADDVRAVTLVDRHGRPMTALVHGRAVLKEPDLLRTAVAAVRLSVENELLHGEVEAQATGARSLPSGAVTFLMTDIEDSTGLLHRLGDRYAALLSDVRRILRGTVNDSGGREVDARADEYFAAFVQPPAALGAAVAIQRLVAGRSWTGGEAVRLRVGLHSGRPTLTDAGYVGLAVNTVARVCAAGHGGQILLSGAAHDAVVRPPDAIGFRRLGAFRLRGLPEPVVLYQVVGEGLPDAFPPPRTSGAG
jgi:class 3 adenylate cyclase